MRTHKITHESPSLFFESRGGLFLQNAPNEWHEFANGFDAGVFRFSPPDLVDRRYRDTGALGEQIKLFEVEGLQSLPDLSGGEECDIHG